LRRSTACRQINIRTVGGNVNMRRACPERRAKLGALARPHLLPPSRAVSRWRFHHVCESYSTHSMASVLQ
jgi:hypothetical protein